MSLREKLTDPNVLACLWGVGAAFGSGYAVATWPGGTVKAAVAAAEVVGLLVIGGMRAMGHGLDDPEIVLTDDGSGERPVWSALEALALSPHHAWQSAPDENGFTIDPVRVEPLAEVAP